MSVKSDASLDEVKDDVSKAIENKGVMALSILDSESVKGTRTMVTGSACTYFNRFCTNHPCS